MQPQVNELLGILELIRIRHKQTLEHVRDVSNIELIMEILCCLAEIHHYFSMQRHGTSHEIFADSLDLLVELLQMAR